MVGQLVRFYGTFCPQRNLQFHSWTIIQHGGCYVSVCHGENLDIKCDAQAGKVIKVDKANYGRLDRRTNCG